MGRKNKAAFLVPPYHPRPFVPYRAGRGRRAGSFLFGRGGLIYGGGGSPMEFWRTKDPLPSRKAVEAALELQRPHTQFNNGGEIALHQNKENKMPKENAETTERGPLNRDWKRAGLGQLPQFAYLSVGDQVQATITAGRVIVKKEKDKKGRITEKIDEVLHLTVAEATTVSRGSERKKTSERIKLAVGDVFALAVGGNMSTLLRDIIKDKSGVILEKEHDITEEDLKPLAGVEIQIKRIPDDTIKKGPWSGNPVKRYEVLYR